MIDRSAVSPCQCVGDVGGVAGPPAFPESGFRQGGPHTVRQHHCRGLYQPPGGNTLGATVRLDVGPSPLVHSLQHHLVSDSGLRFSPVLPDREGVGQDRAGRLQGFPRGSVLALPCVVSQASPTPGPQAGGSPPQAGHSFPARVDLPAPSSGESSPDLLGIVSRSFCAAGLSVRAAELAAGGRRSSTSKVYNSRLRHFFRWCKLHSHRPADSSVGAVGEFLVYLFDSGLAVTTV